MITDKEARECIPVGGFVHKYCAYAYGQTDAPLIYHVGSALSLLSVAVPPTLHMWGFGSKMYPNLFTMLLGKSGADRKTKALSMAEDLMSDLMPDRVGSQPGSYEGLILDLTERPQQLIFEPEMGRFFAQARGGGHLNSLKQGYTELYDCRPVTRKTLRTSMSVRSPRISLFGAVNQAYLEEYLEPTDLTGGFMSRWMVLLGRRTRLNTDRSRDQERYDRMYGALEAILQHAPRGQVELEPSLAVQFSQWEEAIDHRVLQDNSEISSLLSRVPALAQKISILYAVDRAVSQLGEDPELGLLADIDEVLQVGAEVMGPAIKLAEAAHNSILSLHAELCDSVDMRERRKVLEVIPRHTETAISLGLVLRRAKLLKGRAVMLLDTLIEEGEITEIKINEHKKSYIRRNPRLLLCTEMEEK